MKHRSWLLWVIAFLLTLGTAFFQRMTGPSYPIRGKAAVGTTEVAFRLPRSHGGEGDAEVRLPVADPTVGGVMEFRRFRSHDPWSSQPLERRADGLVARVPHQPPAGKVMYRILLRQGAGTPVALSAEPVIIRFRGDVPAYALIPHIALIFGAMLWSTRTGLEAICNGPRIYRLTVWTIVLLFVGGLIGGPVVQKFAFDAYWTGWPFGHDLTDNKTAVAFVFWLIALWRIKKNAKPRVWGLAGSLVLLAIFLTPHSLLGSELDYTRIPTEPSGQTIQE